MTESITIIGAGRVGSALAKAFYHKGIRIDTIISRNKESARGLAYQIEARWSTDTGTNIESGIIILCVPDGEIEATVSGLSGIENTVLLHTAGSYGLDVLGSAVCRGRGVFYPLQTFTKGRNIDIKTVPILIEADNEITGNLLHQLAGNISEKIFIVSTEDRKKIHLAAVFVCNFINHLLYAGEQITDLTSLPSSVLDPLISETMAKAKDIGPEASQTGPAVRNDISTIEKHIDLLSFSPELRDIYKAITQSIIKNLQ